MKKKTVALILALALIMGVFPAAASAAGASGFKDVTDPELIKNLDILGMLGVIAESSDGLWYPQESLTRAEFCKMAVIAMGNEALVSQYKNTSIFPDVRASHWASGYIGVAVKAEGRFVAGYPDGSFGPDIPINYGEAVTVIMRLLGYTDKDCGAVWPQGYISLASAKGIGISGLKGADEITRAQAAKLFVAMLGAARASGGRYYENLGTAEAKTSLVSVDSINGAVKLGNGRELLLAHPVPVHGIIGKNGTPVTDAGGRLLIFLPDGEIPTLAPSSAAVIVSADGSVTGFDALSGNSSNYSIYKNGSRIESKDLKKYDVATYNEKTNTILVCDSRVRAFYEDCTPSTDRASFVTVFGNVKLEVLSTAQDMLAGFKPGMVLTFLLSVDGKVAGAVQSGPDANMQALLDPSGNISLICGNRLLPIAPELESGLIDNYLGKIVSISSTKRGVLSLHVSSVAASSGLDLDAKTVDGKKLADGALIFSDGVLATASDFSKKQIDPDKITYYRTDSRGMVDLVSVKNALDGAFCFGKTRLTTDTAFTLSGDAYEVQRLSLEYGKDLFTSSGACSYDVKNGVYVTAELYKGGYRFVREMDKLGTVTESSWIGSSAVNCGGVTYAVDENAAYYNTDTGKWMESRAAAFAYAKEMTLYAADGIVYLVEIYAK